jgi:DNA repair exonuclease SbcCD ATPase subunit/DNA repair exonuclease SbcCD nuclease subunit
MSNPKAKSKSKSKPKIKTKAPTEPNEPDEPNEPVPEDQPQPVKEEIDLGRFNQMIHISDIHIRPLQRHEEYREVFSRVYTSVARLAKQEVSVIVVTGDLFDHKSVFKPETFKMCRDFLKNLGRISPVIVIAGNHDMMEHNTTRMDSLTPIIDDIPGVNYLKMSGYYRSVHTGDCFVVSSLYDKMFLHCPENSESSVICLYHGDLTGSPAPAPAPEDAGKDQSTRYRTKDDFNGFDAVLLGDIHQHRVFQNDRGAYMSYAGSLIQQNHGETLDGHGFLVWRRGEKNRWCHPTHHPVKNDYGFVDILCEDGVWVNSDILMPKHCYARLLIRDCTQTQLELITAEVKRSVPEDGSLVITKKHAVSVNRAEEAEVTPDPDQERKDDEIDLILQQAKDQGMDGAKLVDLHREYQGQVDQTITMSTSVWRPVWAEFKNLFGYGGGAVNYIRFKRGLTSISAGNACGKSSVVNSLLFGIFGRVPLNPSNSSATYDVVNNRETGGYIKILLNHGGVYYLIERCSCKPKGKTTAADLQRLTKFDFTCEVWESNLNGDKLVNRSDVRQNNNDKFIVELVGDIDSFSLTNLLNKESSLDLLSMTPAEQVRTLKTLFKMDVYDTYRDLNKKKLLEIEDSISRARVRVQSFQSLRDPEATEEALEDLKHAVAVRQGDLEEDEDELQLIQERFHDLQARIRALPPAQVDLTVSLESLQEELDELGEVVNPALPASSVLKVKREALQRNIDKLSGEIVDIDWSSMQSLEDIQQLIEELESELKDITDKIPLNLRKLTLAQANQRLGGVQAKLDDISEISSDLPGPDEIRSTIVELESTLEAWALPLNKAGRVSSLRQKLNDQDLDTEPEGDPPADGQEANLIYQIRELKKQTRKEPDGPPPDPIADDPAKRIEELGSKLIPGIPTEFNMSSERDLKRKQEEISQLTDQLSGLQEILISDNQSIVDGLCDCPLIDESGKEMYDLDLTGEYRLVEDSMIERLIVHFENAHEHEKVIPIMSKLASLNHAVVHLTSTKMNSEIMAEINWYGYLSNLETIERLTQELERVQQWRDFKILQAVKEELHAHEHNARILEEIEKLKLILSKSELRQHAAELQANLDELTQVVTMYDIKEDIAISKQNLGYSNIRDELSQLNVELDELNLNIDKQVSWERFLYLSDAIESYEAARQAERLKPELSRLQTEVSQAKSRVSVSQQELKKLTDRQALMEFKIEQQRGYQAEMDLLTEQILCLEASAKILGDYNLLMGSKGIASKMLFNKIKSVETYINSILTSFTRYNLSIIFDDKKQTMHIVADDKETGKSLSTTRFSGYEKLMLQIAFKRALNKYSYNSKSSLIVIDEALDCIDTENFTTKLPDVMNLITQDYSTCLAISQRDISHISDINMTISVEGGSSRLRG